MTPENQKALDDLDLLEEIGWFPEQDETGLAARFERIRRAITAQAVTDDEVRLAVNIVRKRMVVRDRYGDKECEEAIEAMETLIRAATQPPQATGEQRLAALVWVEERLKVLREWQHHRENEEDGQLTYVDKSREIKIYETLKSTLQSPAVPREAVSAIGRIIQQAVGDDEIIKQSAYEVCIEGADLEALAMLGGKEG